MDKLKKLNGSMIAAIVLSVLLIMSVTAGATLAWFASRDSASTSLTMGEAVVVTIGEDYKQGNGVLAMNLPVSEGGLLPGMSVTPNIKVQLQQSNTNALLRARFLTTVEYPEAYVDAAYSDTTKYVGAAGSETPGFAGRVLEEKEITGYEYNADGNLKLDASGKPIPIYGTGYAYNVFAGPINYDYYDSMGRLINAGADLTLNTADDTYYTEVGTNHTISKWLSRVEVRDEIVELIDSGSFTISGVQIPVTAANAAELEIRQRGVDLTNAINRVLAGQRGYGIDPSTGAPVLNETVGVKYTRRVADGWAYRDADQAWYYLGSQTNGFVLENQTGVDETVTTTQVAKDIAWYSEETAGNLTVMQPHYTTLGYDSNPYKTELDAQDDDKNRNYLGGAATDANMDVVANEIAVLNQATMASIDLSAGNVSIDFLTRRFVLPTFINNNYAKAKVTFTFTVEAVQDYLVDPLQESTSAADRLPNNLVNAIIVFNNAFPQALSTDTSQVQRTIEATGAVTNVVPGGGIPSSVNWDAAAGTIVTSGDTALKYTGNQVTGALYSYGYLADSIISGADGWTYDSSITATPSVGSGTVGGTGGVKTTIKGFATKVDDYGDKVADYTTAADYVRGTASSIGIAPYIDAQQGTAGTDETWPATGA